MSAAMESSLRPLERVALGVARAYNRSPRLKRAAHWVNLSCTYRLVRWLSASRVHVIGGERLAGLDLSRGVLFAPNHRSFFDLFLIMAALEPLARRARRMYFPVRSGFWYDSLSGI